MLKLTNLSKYYHTNNNVALALHKISLEFNKGEFVAITGESGSGKTTLLNVLSGSDSYEEGEMYIDNQPTSHYGREDWEQYRRKYIGFIYQTYNLIDSYTVLENVECALLINETNEKLEDIKKRAIKYLDKVGLHEQIYKKATQLSSGQKQRLAIARALAKETDIIVADEPTGNLDVENGMEIMEILHELSKEKLVIVVTHNYEQAKNYATRKVRLFDGEIVDDIQISKKAEIEDSSIIQPDEKLNKRQQKKKKRTLAFRFVWMNKKAQPRRNLLILMLMLFISFSFFIFLGGFISNMDDATSRVYSKAAFPNGDKTRLCIRYEDQKQMTQQDLTKVLGLQYVVEADIYDTVNDIAYYCNENEDYTYEYNVKEDEQYDMPDSTTVKMLESDKFMRSEMCINESELVAGRMPEAFNEIILGNGDEDDIGKEIKFYFNNSKLWPALQYVGYNMTVVGVVDANNDEQVYFDEELCDRFNAKVNSVTSEVVYINTASGRGISKTGTYASVVDETIFEADKLYSSFRNTMGMDNAVFIPNKYLTDNNVRFSSLFYDRNIVMLAEENYKIEQFKIAPIAILNYVNSQKETVKSQLKLSSIESDCGTMVIEISQELFDQMFPDRNNYQISIYIEDYAYTDEVIDELVKAGYDAISIFRAGATTLDEELVQQKLFTMIICLGALVVVFVIGILIVSLMLKLKKGDFIIYKALGMKQSMVSGINKVDIYGSIFITTAFVLALMLGLSLLDVTIITNITKYFRIWHYAIYVVINFLFSFVLLKNYNSFLAKKTSIIMLHE